MVNEKYKVWLWRPLADVVAALGITPLFLKLIGTPIPALADLGLDKWIAAFGLVLLADWFVVKKWK